LSRAARLWGALGGGSARAEHPEAGGCSWWTSMCLPAEAALLAKLLSTQAEPELAPGGTAFGGGAAGWRVQGRERGEPKPARSDGKRY